jgi:ArsR family transcriptional regulator
MTVRTGEAQAVRVARALGDPMRFRIFKEIAGRAEISCQELVERFTLAQPTISHHLKVLSQAGLLSVRKQGPFHLYSARRDVLGEHLRKLGEVIAAPVRERSA